MPGDEMPAADIHQFDALWRLSDIPDRARYLAGQPEAWVERRPPRLDLAIYPYLPRATVEKTSVKAYMRLLSSDAGEAA